MPTLLDLFCGVGGCSAGYASAGFTVTGVDVVAQPDYPYAFHRADATTWPLADVDAVHASPPCKSFTVTGQLVRLSRDRQPVLFEAHADLLSPTLERLAGLTVPWVVENVPGAPMPAGAVTYCGSSFGLRVRRHRLFASNAQLAAPPCDHARQGRVVGVYGQGGNSSAEVLARVRGRSAGTRVTGPAAAVALGITWSADQSRLSQAIPPAYTAHIGAQLLMVLGHRPLRSDHDNPPAAAAPPPRR